MRYMLFAGYNYYPEGGMNDFRGRFDTMVQAIQAIGAAHSRYEWFNILDTETGRVYDHYEANTYGNVHAWAQEIDEHSEQVWNDTGSF